MITLTIDPFFSRHPFRLAALVLFAPVAGLLLGLLLLQDSPPFVIGFVFAVLAGAPASAAACGITISGPSSYLCGHAAAEQEKSFALLRTVRHYGMVVQVPLLVGVIGTAYLLVPEQLGNLLSTLLFGLLWNIVVSNMVVGIFFGTQDDVPTLLRRHGFPVSNYVPPQESPAVVVVDGQPISG